MWYRPVILATQKLRQKDKVFKEKRVDPLPRIPKGRGLGVWSGVELCLEPSSEGLWEWFRSGILVRGMVTSLWYQ